MNELLEDVRLGLYDYSDKELAIIGNKNKYKWIVNEEMIEQFAYWFGKEESMVFNARLNKYLKIANEDPKITNLVEYFLSVVNFEDEELGIEDWMSHISKEVKK